jgi:hypothetical protein
VDLADLHLQRFAAQVMFGESHVWLRFALAALATWRVTHLLANEDGPANAIVRIRRRLGNGFWGTLTDCFNCLSLWVALPMAFLVGDTAMEWLVGWLALSGAACLLERAGRKNSSGPVIIRHVETGEEVPKHDLLWTESRDVEE